MGIPPLYLLLAALCLVIPLAVVAGHGLPGGPIVVTAGLALATFAVYWLILSGIIPITVLGSPFLVTELVFFGGILLLVAAWTLALSASAAARSWRWVALLTVAGYLCVVAVLILFVPPDPCLFTGPVVRESLASACSDSDATLRLLVIAAFFAGPAAALAYGLRARVPHVRSLPSGLTVSPLGESKSEAEPDAELEVRRERL